jgi:PLP dependent protein
LHANRCISKLFKQPRAADNGGFSLAADTICLVSVRDNLEGIRERIITAAQRAGRSASDIALMAVCKLHPAERIIEAYTAGQRVFGENRVQEFADKAPALTHLHDARFHLIGHLQSNKAARAAQLFHAVDSVDSLKLARRLNAAAQQTGKRLPVLIEINVGGESAKAGLAPGSEDLYELLAAAPALEALEIRGLMTIPPFTEDPNGARPFFQKLRELRDVIRSRDLPSVSMDELSMGMSHDFDVAIEEGSTCVRVGTAIFGARL